MNRTALYLLFLLLPTVGRAQYKMTTQEYIDTYKYMAIRSMEEFGIPASITLAQGLLESGNGGSRLAVEGNNHFGIKCKGSWTGAKIYHDDDAKGECFRKYRNAEHSYRDHSKFLTESPRYADLFKLDITDYKGWAYGLKAAGYATNPKYPQLLIDLIEKNRLYQLDRPNGAGGLLARRKERKAAEAELNEPLAPKHTVEKNNGVKYIVSQTGESFASIAAQYGLSVKRLLKINDLKNSFPLPEGTALYIEPKRNRSSSAAVHTIDSGDSYHSVSQQYGIKLKKLQKMNPVTRKFPPRVGQQLRLR
ncbi:glucosaminidase domain-containing protein [Rikenella microfusus]|uniref:glucosaminidase domain-containing protein n=1 Tax=Rikenella microfusus TaxID=28139 RepID=UPI003A95ABF8